MYRIRTRRHRRTAQVRFQRTPHLVTAEDLLNLLKFDPQFAARYAGAWSQAARRVGIIPASITYTPLNGRHFRTYAYDLKTQAVDILKVMCAYKRTATAFGLAGRDK